MPKQIDHNDFVKYEITGCYKSGRRFNRISTGSYKVAMQYNIYKGTLWGVTKEGKRVKVREYIN